MKESKRPKRKLPAKTEAALARIAAIISGAVLRQWQREIEDEGKRQ